MWYEDVKGKLSFSLKNLGAVAAYCGLIVDPSFLSSLFVIWWFVRSLRNLETIEELEKSTINRLIVMVFVCV